MISLLQLTRQVVDSPISRNEIARLRRQAEWRNPWMTRASYMLIAFASIMASLPLWMTITDDFPTYLLLPLIAASVYAVHIMTAARTLILAVHSVTQEQKPGAWDNLFLTGLDARLILLSKWYAVMSYVWLKHVLAALLKVGLVYGLVQFFDVINLSGCMKHFGEVLCYGSYPYYQVRMYPGDPPVRLVMLGAVMLVSYGLLEAGLLTALGIASSLITAKHHSVGFVIAGIVRVVLVLAAVSSWQFIEQHGSPFLSNITTPYVNAQLPRFSSSVQSAAHNLSETMQLTLSTLADNASILVSDLMRPFAPPSHLLRRMVALSCGLGLYVVLLSLFLRLGVALMIRLGALRPIDP
jgi:hypothetical protein